MRRAEDGAVEAALRVELDALDVYELLRNLVDPEKPNCTLEQLNIVRPDLIEVAADARGHCSIITVLFHPTVPHCSLARHIGLCVRLRLRESLPAEHKINIRVSPGSHHDEVALNRVLNDKERVVAALEVPQVLAQLQALLPPD